MATDINNVTLIGRLTRDPELRMAGSTSLAAFSLASNRTYNHNGERRDETLFIDCTAWGRLSEIVKQYCTKGKQVCVNGRLKQSSWQDQNGQKRSKIEIVVENLQLLGGGGGDNSGSYGGQQGATDYAPSGFGGQQAPQQNPMGGGGGYNNPPPVADEFEDDDIPF